jgi:tRNA pseudouridine38-40 synthase
VALRGTLPRDLTLREAAEAEPGFSARFAARERVYVYAILNRPAPSALLARYSHHVPQPLDLTAMREAAAWLVGEHDFRSFSAALADSMTVRTLRRLAIDPVGELLRLEFAADGFLHHMVRTIVGTLTEVGAGRRRAAELAVIREARDRSAAGFTAPAQGLYLAGVRYAGYDSFAEPPVLRGAAAGALDAERAFP